jgi:lactate permease
LYEQVHDPVGGSLGLSTLLAVLPLMTLFVLLAGLRLRAYRAGLIALAVALTVAIAGYGMPVGQAFGSAAEGAAFGLFPILWIVVNAVWIYTLTVASGHFHTLRHGVAAVSGDQRIQALIVGFSFGALLEALAGFGAPVAITVGMLLALGFEPLKAAGVALIGNTAPAAFGAIATPIVTLSAVTGISERDLGSMVGRQLPFLALLVPFVVVYLVDGRRGLRETWPVALAAGSAFAVGQFVTSNYISVELTDVIASLASLGATTAYLWLRHRPGAEPPAMSRETIASLSPYLILIAVLTLAQLGRIKRFLADQSESFRWPGLDVTSAGGDELPALMFKLDWLAAPGTLLLLSGLLTVLALRIHPRVALRAYVDTIVRLREAIVTVMVVLALAYVMNLSGETVTIGLWAAGAGGMFALISPLIGWLGVAVTGSVTSSNSLLGELQVAAAHQAGLSPTLMAAANSSGGVFAKMLSPQHLAIAAAAAGMIGREGDLMRSVLRWSLALVAVICVIVYLQSTAVLDWMVP